MNDLIYSYTRQDAIDDGVFVDVSEVAKNTGFKIPVALTTNLFATHIQKEDETETNKCLKTFLRNLHADIITNANRNESLFTTKVYFDNKTPTIVWVAIEAQSPTDPSPALNCMLPEDY